MTGTQEDWRPVCSRQRLQQAAQLRHCVREFFDSRDYLEVQTPVLSQDIVIDAHLEPLEVQVSGQPFFLQTSPEAAMKRLLSAGSGSIYQITPAFRDGETGPWHNPEFCMLEWYGVETDWKQQLQLTEDLVRAAAAEVSNSVLRLPARPFAITTYQQAFRRSLDLDVLSVSDDELADCCRQRLAVESLPEDRDELLNLLLDGAVEPELGRQGPEFLINYPASQAALARLAPEDPRVALRFELYLDGLELCNGYQELTDADELHQRDTQQLQKRQQMSASQLPGAPRLLAAMAAGLPECSGVALGMDRLLVALTGAPAIQECLPFPVDRA